MARMWELSDEEFKKLINMLRVLMNKIDSMKEQVGNASKEIEILRKKQKEKQEIKNTVQK